MILIRSGKHSFCNAETRFHRLDYCLDVFLSSGLPRYPSGPCRRTNGAADDCLEYLIGVEFQKVNENSRSKFRMIAYCPSIGTYIYLNDHVLSVVYIFYHTNVPTNTSNDIRDNKKFCPLRRSILKELQLNVPVKFFVLDEQDVDTLNVPNIIRIENEVTAVSHIPIIQKNRFNILGHKMITFCNIHLICYVV